MDKSDFLLIGAGIMGLTLALKLKINFPNKKIVILEKSSRDFESINNTSWKALGLISRDGGVTPLSAFRKLLVEGVKILPDWFKQVNQLDLVNEEVKLLPIDDYHFYDLGVKQEKNYFANLFRRLKREEADDGEIIDGIPNHFKDIFQNHKNIKTIYFRKNFYLDNKLLIRKLRVILNRLGVVIKGSHYLQGLLAEKNEVVIKTSRGEWFAQKIFLVGGAGNKKILEKINVSPEMRKEILSFNTCGEMLYGSFFPEALKNKSNVVFKSTIFRPFGQYNLGSLFQKSFLGSVNRLQVERNGKTQQARNKLFDLYRKVFRKEFWSNWKVDSHVSGLRNVSFYYFPLVKSLNNNRVIIVGGLNKSGFSLAHLLGDQVIKLLEDD